MPIGQAVEVDIFGGWIEGEMAREPLFDPAGERVRVSPAADAWVASDGPG